jgi:hypothetical protein
MARREGVLDRFSPAWHPVFSFTPHPEEYPAVESLQKSGVREIEGQYGRSADGSLFMNLKSVTASKGQVVNVDWLKQVRGLCESMGPQLSADVALVAGPDGDDPGTDFRHLVTDGDLMLFVWMRFDKRIGISVDVVIPASDVVEVPVEG